MSKKKSDREILSEALAAHRARKGIRYAAPLSFIGADGLDVYNVSQAFGLGGQRLIAGRVEPRATELSSTFVFAEIAPNVFEATPFRFPGLQDPSVAFLRDGLLLGGTEIYPNAEGRIEGWRTVFFLGSDLAHLQKTIFAPLKMKDVRIAEKNGTYYVFSRPQGGVAGYGKIGFATAPSLSAITTDRIAQAPLIEDLFGPVTWGGVNQIHFLRNGWLGLLGHVAIMSPGDVRHYYGMVFALNPKNGRRTPYKIIAERSDFPSGPAKRPDLTDVIFVGGLNRRADGAAELYAGLSDAEAALAVIDDPFLEYEQER